MKASRLVLAASILGVLASSCDDEMTPTPGGGIGGGGIGSSDWTIPIDQILDGGPGKDGIPALENPVFVPAAEADFLDDNELVVGIQINGEARAYPHMVLDYHEIANDELGGVPISVNYCPLTGTGMAWGREINGTVTTFGVSGLLYNSNLIPYDRNTDSNWSQILREGVNGELLGETAELYPVIETTWGSWKQMAPHTTVINLNTGFVRNYLVYPYGNYKETEGLLFPVVGVAPEKGEIFHPKDRIFGVPLGGDEVQVYSLEDFTNGRAAVFTTATGKIVVAGNERENFAVAFDVPTQIGTNEEFIFTYIPNELPVILEDQFGNRYDVFGNVVAGDGNPLDSRKGFIGYWFSWPGFFRQINM